MKCPVIQSAFLSFCKILVKACVKSRRFFHKKYSFMITWKKYVFFKMYK